MIEHMTPGERDEALAGDLLEAFREGRSRRWYWKQVAAAIALAWIGCIFRHRMALLFALAWSMLSPAWELLIIRFNQTSRLYGDLWAIPWPWSTVSVISESLAETMLFVVCGALVYAIFAARPLRSISLRWMATGVAISVVVNFGVFFVALALMAFIPHSGGHAIDWRTLTIVGVLENHDVSTIIQRLEYFVYLAIVLWGIAPTREKQQYKAA